MAVPQLLTDIVQVLLDLAPAASLVALVLAGISLRRDGGATLSMGGGFTKWMLWAVLFVTLVPLLGWFSSFGVAAPVPSGGISSSWLNAFQSDVSSFVTNFIVGRIVTTLAAYFVLRAILDTASGGHPLPSVLAAMFLLGTQATYTLIAGLQQRNPVRPGGCPRQPLELSGRDDHADRGGPRNRGRHPQLCDETPGHALVAVALAMLCVSGIWKLVLSMEA